MAKLSSSDIIEVLAAFGVGDESTRPHDVRRVIVKNITDSAAATLFQFKKFSYIIIGDNTADDDASYLNELSAQVTDQLLHIVDPVIRATEEQLHILFKGREVYLLRSDKAIETRLDTYLASEYPDHSRSTWQKYIKAGYIQVNGKTEVNTHYKLRDTDAVTTHIPDEPKEQLALSIIYLDDDIIVVEKPAGILTHSKGALNTEATVADFFRNYTSWGLDTNRPGIVHRLDRDTSGVIVGARHADAAKSLQKQFSERTVKKTYFAVVSGVPSAPEAVIDVPIGRNAAAPSTFKADPHGKSALTTYKVIKHSDTRSLVELTPQTGRTHQLRVHMEYIGIPILGDAIYSTTPADRMYLHATSLELTRPDRVRDTFVSSVPQEFEQRV